MKNSLAFGTTLLEGNTAGSKRRKPLRNCFATDKQKTNNSRLETSNLLMRKNFQNSPDKISPSAPIYFNTLKYRKLRLFVFIGVGSIEGSD